MVYILWVCSNVYWHTIILIVLYKMLSLSLESSVLYLSHSTACPAPGVFAVSLVLPLPFAECPIVGIIWHVAFRDWLPLLSKMYTSFPHDSSFVFSTEYYSIVRMYCCLFIHSSIEGHLVCFQVLAVVNKAAVNIMCRFCRDVSFQLLWVNTKEWDYWIDMSVFSFLRSYQTVI